MLTPATVMDRAALAVRWVSTNFSLSAGLPEWSRVDAVVVCAMVPPVVRVCAAILAHPPFRPDQRDMPMSRCSAASLGTPDGGRWTRGERVATSRGGPRP